MAKIAKDGETAKEFGKNFYFRFTQVLVFKKTFFGSPKKLIGR